MSTRNTEDPTRSGEFRQGSDFQTVKLLCIQGSLFSQFSRLPNDLRMTSERPLERHQDFSQNDHLSTKTHRLQTIHPMRTTVVLHLPSRQNRQCHHRDSDWWARPALWTPDPNTMLAPADLNTMPDKMRDLECQKTCQIKCQNVR